MASGISVKIKNNSLNRFIDKLNTYKDVPNKSEANDIAEKMLKKIKELISVGISPISGRKMPGYRGSYKQGIKDGVYSKYGKQQRPINLKLTGDFLKALNTKTKKAANSQRYSVIISIDGEKEVLKEKGHREGANGQAERPIIPKGSENFTQKVLVIFIEGINSAISKRTKA